MFAVLHIADFALHAVLRTESGIAGKPAALFAGSTKKSSVIATNPAARARGVELGMTAPQAVARCTTLVIRAPRAAAEIDARAALLAVGFTLSPLIEDTAPGVCTIDLKGNSTNPAPPATTAVAQLAHLGLPTTAGIARTPLLALYAARAAGENCRPGLSRPHPKNPLTRAGAHPPAVSAQDPTSLAESQAPYFTSPARVLSVVDEATFLGPLPLAAADPSPSLAGVLFSWGLRTLGDLTALPCDDLVRRFGAEGLALWQRARGGSARPLHPVVPPQVFHATMEFEEGIETLEPLLFILRRFLDRLTLELKASQHVASELGLALTLEDATRHQRSFRLPEPTSDGEILFRALHTHLESLQTPAAIIALELTLTPARPLVRQQGLFETGLRDPHGFGEMLARVSVLVGADRVGTPQLEDTHRPNAFHLVPPAAVVPPPAEPPLHPPLGVPLRRFRPPLPVKLAATDDGASYLWSDALRGEICHRSPAYPRSGDWWQADRAWQRTEWDIALAEGGLYRLLLIGDQHFIEGEYD